MTTADDLLRLTPDTTVSARSLGVPSDMQVPAFTRRTEYVPEVDEAYRFDPETTLAILAGFAFNRRVMVQGTAPASPRTSNRWRRTSTGPSFGSISMATWAESIW
jgi:hypothetical protein